MVFSIPRTFCKPAVVYVWARTANRPPTPPRNYVGWSTKRLRKKRRGALATHVEPHVGTRLWRDAAQHGAQAIGQPAGAIEVGRRADWLVLDADHPSLPGAATDTALDHLLFAGADAAIRDVMVAGRWVIKDHRHPAEERLRPRFASLMSRLATAQ